MEYSPRHIILYIYIFIYIFIFIYIICACSSAVVSLWMHIIFSILSKFLRSVVHSMIRKVKKQKDRIDSVSVSWPFLSYLLLFSWLLYSSFHFPLFLFFLSPGGSVCVRVCFPFISGGKWQLTQSECEAALRDGALNSLPCACVRGNVKRLLDGMCAKIKSPDEWYQTKL